MQVTGSPRYQSADWYHPPHKCGGRGRLRRQLYKFQFIRLMWETGKYIILYFISHTSYLCKCPFPHGRVNPIANGRKMSEEKAFLFFKLCYDR